jgi:hypothetical protein
MALPDSIDQDEEGLTSGILPIVYELLSREPGCNVVDLGAVSTHNCMMFSRNGARVYIDTSGDSLRSTIREHNDVTPADIDNLLERCPTPIEVLLFWDLMDYLSMDAIKMAAVRFCEAMREGGVLYTLASRQRFIPRDPVVIDIIREDRLQFRQEGEIDREAPQYAPKQLEQYLPGFFLDKMYLMQNGMQEHLFLFEGTQ